MVEIFWMYWPWLTSGFLFLAATWATGHVVLFKRDSRSALAWVGLIWFAPIAGIVFYMLFGINRIQRKARKLRRKQPRANGIDSAHKKPSPNLHGLEPFRHFLDTLTGRPVLQGNRIVPHETGESVFSEMLEAIKSAEKSIALSTYIFDNDSTGREFAQALAEAVKRGIEVRVLLDDIGSRYSIPSIVGTLRAAGVSVSLFLPTFLPWRFPYAQLRNHRKILVVDGQIGFTGGMNIREGHDSRSHSLFPIRDCHFRIEGPVVNDLRSTFADDWEFTTGERLFGPKWFPELELAGPVAARGIAGGPDDDFEKLRMTYLGAIACAQKTIRIITPYFVPDTDLLSALGVAALRGVQVDILVPEQNNLKLVHWAMMAQLEPLVANGCRIWLTPPPFDHTKIFQVDGEWCLIGSANWDARSLRLNFEFDLECYDTTLSGQLKALMEKIMKSSREITGEELRKRTLFCKLRDGIARLASSYL